MAAMGPGGGFMPGAVGGRSDGDEDREKSVPEYLESDDLFKDDRPVSKPVWGA
jgi:hypothetical protein